MATRNKIPTLYGLTEPSKGTGTLWYDAGYSRVQLSFKAPQPWNSSGLQPFSWDYIKPKGEQVYPIIRVMAQRQVNIVATITTLSGAPPGNKKIKLVHIAGKANVGPGKYLGRDLNGNRALFRSDIIPRKFPSNVGCYGIYDEIYKMPWINDFSPMLQLIRPQINSPSSHHNARIKTYDLLRPPYLVSPGLMPGRLQTERGDVENIKKNNRTVLISQHRTGVIFNQIEGKYSIDIRIKNPLKPAAYHYDLINPEDTTRNDFWVRVVHNANVKITVFMKTGHYDKVAVISARVADKELHRVPFQNEEIPVDTPTFKYNFNTTYVDKRKNVGSPSIGDVLFEAFNTGIGLIPIVGDIYDIGQFAYAAATGSDFSGHRVSNKELLILGGAILLPAGLQKAL